MCFNIISQQYQNLILTETNVLPAHANILTVTLFPGKE